MADEKNAQDSWLATTSIGRVLDAFGQGAKDGWGAGPLGLSPESEKALRDGGIFKTLEPSFMDSFKSFNEAMLRPAAAGLDAVMRGVGAVTQGAANVIGQTADETGLSQAVGKPGSSLTRDMLVLADTLGIVSGNVAPRGVRGFKAERDPMVPAAPDGPAARPFEKPAPVERPHDTFAPEAPAVDKAGNINLDRIAAPADVKNVIREAALGVPRVNLDPATAGDAFGNVAPHPIIASEMETNASLRRGYHGLSAEDQIRVNEIEEAREGKVGSEAAKLIDEQESLFQKGRQNLEQKAADLGFMDARRGVIPLKQTEELADALGMTPEFLTSRKVGQAFNAEEAVAARNLLVQSAENVRNMALKAAGGADADIIAFKEAMTKHVAIQEQVAGLTAEAGRALSSFRIMAKGTGEAQDLAEVIKQMGGRENIDEIARKITSLNSPQQISKFLADSRTAKTSDMLTEVWINALLSGPQTHVVNTISNSLIALWQVPETAAAAAVGKARTMFGIGSEERVMFGEAAARAYGIGQGAKDGIVAAWSMFKSDMGVVGAGDTATSQFGLANKVEARTRRAVPSKTVTIGGKQFEIGGAQLRTPTNLLSAEDEFFKAVAYRQEINALAYRQAAASGLRGQEFADRVAELTNNPTENMMKAARENADYQTFQKRLGHLGGAVQQFSNAHPAAKLVVPFVRTPVNIIKYAGERSPLGAFSDEFKGLKGDVARDTAIARMTLGTSVGIAAATLTAEGLMTGGGPTDSRQRAVLYASGWQPYSVKIGDMYYSYSRLDPFALTLGVAADMHDIASKMTEPEADKLAALITASISKNLVNKTWLKGPAELIQAVQDPDRYGEKYVQNLMGTAVPTGLAQAARVDDPYLRDARTLIDTIKARTPGMSSSLMPKRDIWGEPIELEGGLGPDLFSPIYERRIKDDPVAQELIRLKVWPAPVERKIRGVELTPEQYDKYQMYAGRYMRFNLQLMVGSEGWSQIPEFARTEAIQRTVTKSRAAATSLMMMENPDLIEKAVTERVKKISGSSAGK
jgi:hypothetical protein